MNYQKKEKLMIIVSLVTAIISVFGLSFITTKITNQWLALIFLLCGYSMLWWTIIYSEIGTTNSLYSRIYSKIGNIKYELLVIGPILIGIAIASSNKITNFIFIVIIHLVISVILTITYTLTIEYIQDLPDESITDKESII